MSGKPTGLGSHSAPAEVQAASPFCLPSVFWESEFRLNSAESCSKLWKLLLGGGGDKQTQASPAVPQQQRVTRSPPPTAESSHLRNSWTSPWLLGTVGHSLTGGMETSLVR